MDLVKFSLIVGVIAIAVVAFVRRKFAFWADRGVIFVKPEFPFGNFRGVSRTVNTYEILQKYYNQLKPSGDSFMGMFIFLKPIAVALDLEFIKNIMVKDFQHFQDHGAYYNEKDDPLSAHLFAIDGQKWSNLRKKLTPTFTSGKMKMMFPTVIRIGKEFKTTLEDIIKVNPEIEIREILARFTTDIIGNCAFGLDCNSLKDPDAEFRKYGRMMFENFKTGKILLMASFKNLSRKLHMVITPPPVTEFFMNAVKQTIKYREENNVKRNDFMDLLIEIKNDKNVDNQLTVEEIAAQAFVFFIAGFETSSTVMSFALYELALNQKVQNKARECVQAVLKKNNGELTYESLMEMTYINQCINESLRKYPPVPDLFRIVTQDYQVPNTKVVFSKDQTVFIPVYAIHHDPALYENPEVYDPDRFTPENEAKRNPFSFLPFGEGPRNCIGLRFGLMQARIGLAVLLSNFKIELSEKTSVPLNLSKSALILTPVGGIWLKFQKL